MKNREARRLLTRWSGRLLEIKFSGPLNAWVVHVDSVEVGRGDTYADAIIMAAKNAPLSSKEIE